MNSSNRRDEELGVPIDPHSLLPEQVEFLRLIVAEYKNGNHGPFSIWRCRPGSYFSYLGRKAVKVAIDPIDLKGLEHVGFIEYSPGAVVYKGKPTTLGIAWITELDRKTDVETATTDPGDGQARSTGPSEHAAGGNSPTAAARDRALSSGSIQASDPTRGGGGRLFRRSGKMWTLTFNSKTVTIEDAKGFSYICYLLQRPGHSTPVVELLAITDSAGASLDIRSAGDVLDAKAISHYRRHLDEIRSEITEAERNHDLGRKEVLENEAEQIKRELASARGLGGRNRRLDDDAERVRKAVSNSVSRAITSIRKHHSELADHLQRCVSRGRELCYTGDGVAWTF